MWLVFVMSPKGCRREGVQGDRRLKGDGRGDTESRPRFRVDGEVEDWGPERCWIGGERDWDGCVESWEWDGDCWRESVCCWECGSGEVGRSRPARSSSVAFSFSSADFFLHTDLLLDCGKRRPNQYACDTHCKYTHTFSTAGGVFLTAFLVVLLLFKTGLYIYVKGMVVYPCTWTVVNSLHNYQLLHNWLHSIVLHVFYRHCF